MQESWSVAYTTGLNCPDASATTDVHGERSPARKSASKRPFLAPYTAQSMEGHHCRCSSWCQFYGMRPNDRCLSLYDEWTRSLEGCGGAVFDAHRLSFRILPVLETTCHRAAESQVVVDARRARTLDALPSIEYEHGANSGALAVVATDPSGARGLLRACAPPSSSLLSGTRVSLG